MSQLRHRSAGAGGLTRSPRSVRAHVEVLYSFDQVRTTCPVVHTTHSRFAYMSGPLELTGRSTPLESKSSGGEFRQVDPCEAHPRTFA